MNTLKKIGKLALWLLVIIAAFIVIVLLWLRAVSPGKTEPIVDANGQVIEGSIAEVLHKEINGVEQFFILRGKSVDNPVLLMLHGGPGSPQAHMNLKYNKELEDHFLVVNWDQRAAGASYADDIDETTMTIGQFVDDTYSVTQYLKQRFHKQKIFILGHSWGSYLGMRTVYEHPESYYAYIGIGQVSNQRKSEDLSYTFVYKKAKESGNTEALEELESIGAPVNGDYSDPIHDIPLQRKWVNEFGGAAYEKSTMEILRMLILPIFTFREYKMADKLNYVKGMLFTQRLLWNEMLNHQLVDEVKKVEIPIYIFQGVHDYQTVYSEAKVYFDSIQAPVKEFFTFQNSAHMLPYNSEKDKFHKIMIEQIQPIGK